MLDQSHHHFVYIWLFPFLLNIAHSKGNSLFFFFQYNLFGEIFFEKNKKKKRVA